MKERQRSRKKEGMGGDWAMGWWGKNTGEWGKGARGTLGCRHRTDPGDLATSDLWPPQMPGCCPQPQTQQPSHPSGIHRNESWRGCHLLWRERGWTGSLLGNWVQRVSIPGNLVSRKALRFWEVGGGSPCLLSMVYLSALGEASSGS